MKQEIFKNTFLLQAQNLNVCMYDGFDNDN